MKRFATMCLMACAIAVVLLPAALAAATPVPVEPGKAIAGQFESARNCGCHQTLVQEWSPSMHAQALSDPIFKAKLAQAQAATDGKLGPFCLTCHGPGATMTSEMASGQLTQSGSEGITCTFCHQVVGLAAGEPGDTSQVLEMNGVRRAQLKDPQAPHPAEYSEFHTKAELCGGCHNVNHPVNGMHLESTYREWAESPYAVEGVVCQDCHMSAEPGMRGPSSGTAAAGGPSRDNLYHMNFVGANVILGPADASTARLKNSATVELEVAEVVAAGEEASVTVKTTNSGAGHYLPTGLTEVREMWLEVTATNAAGEPVKLGEHRFGTILQDAKGNAPVELWEATSIKSDDRIAPRATVSDAFTFTMPDGVDASTISAALYYRSIPDELAKEAGVENVTTTMASAESRVFASDQAKAAADTPATVDEGGSAVLLWAVVAVLAVAVIGGGLWLKLRKSRAS